MSVKKPVRNRSRKSSASRSRSTSPTKVNLSMEVTIDRLAHDGRGIGQCDGKVVFVDQALPKESHKIKVVSEKSKFIEAISEALTANLSADRVEPVCPAYASCGGCQIQHLEHKAQLAFKSTLVLDQLRRAKLDIADSNVVNIVSKNDLAYRTRARLSLNHRGDPYAGFKARANNQIVKIDHCPVLVESLNHCLAPLQSALTHFRPQVLGHIEMIQGRALPILILRHISSLNETELSVLAEFAHNSNVEIYLQPESESRYFSLDGGEASIRFTMQVPKLEQSLTYQASNFSQINPPLNYAMIEQALDWAKPSETDLWLDLFCGVGNLSFPFAALAGQVVGVEAIVEMVAQAKNNASQLGVINCNFLAADLDKIESLRKLPKKIDGVILDPPRAGAKLVVENISRLKPKKILYISCDPATFSRDAKVLVDTGYRIEKIGALDMFPQTMHVETMALFIRQ